MTSTKSACSSLRKRKSFLIKHIRQIHSKLFYKNRRKFSQFFFVSENLASCFFGLRCSTVICKFLWKFLKFLTSSHKDIYLAKLGYPHFFLVLLSWTRRISYKFFLYSTVIWYWLIQWIKNAAWWGNSGQNFCRKSGWTSSSEFKGDQFLF